MDEGARLYRAWLEGDEQAFSRLVSLYRDGLILFIARLCGNIDMAEEVAADCFADLIIRPRRYNGSVAFKTYLYAIGHHKAVSALRHYARMRTLPFEEAPPKSIAYASFEDEMLRDEQRRELHAALAHLREDYRKVLHLLYFEEMSYKEAAAVLHCSPKKVDNLATRGKQALRKLMEQEVKR